MEKVYQWRHAGHDRRGNAVLFSNDTTSGMDKELHLYSADRPSQILSGTMTAYFPNLSVFGFLPVISFSSSDVTPQQMSLR